MDILTHLFAGGLGAIVHPIFGYFSKKADNKHAERMEQISIKEVEAEAKEGIQVAEAATKTAIAKGELTGWQESYHLGDLAAFPKGVKLPNWAGGLLAISAFCNGMIHFLILVGTFAGALAVGTPVWTHALGAAIGWALGYHAAVAAGLVLPKADATT